MNEQIKQIATRLKGLRDAIDITENEAAEACGITLEQYQKYESGEADIPVSILHNIGQKYNVDLSTLMFGDEPHMSTYYLTRKGDGAIMERNKAYRYRSLANGFMNRKADPFMVTIEPKGEDEPMHLNSHAGQEFNYIVEGRVIVRVGGKDLILEAGDSIYFNSALPHGLKALDGRNVTMLAIIF